MYAEALSMGDDAGIVHSTPGSGPWVSDEIDAMVRIATMWSCSRTTRGRAALPVSEVTVKHM